MRRWSVPTSIPDRDWFQIILVAFSLNYPALLTRASLYHPEIHTVAANWAIDQLHHFSLRCILKYSGSDSIAAKQWLLSLTIREIYPVINSMS